jgi:thiopeptide-type bacteriocin biosynthesis protein
MVLVRMPLLPIDHYYALSEAARPDRGRCAEVAEPAVGPPDPLPLLPDDPRIRQALAVGSDALLDALERPVRSRRDGERLRGKLLRYLIRMSTRPTPYGLFAGVALAEWGSHTDLSLSEACGHKRTQPDMAWLLGLVLGLEQRPEVRVHLRLLANPMAMIQGDRLVLMERAASTEQGPAPLVSVRATGVVQRAVARARVAIDYADLVAHLLATTPGATPAQVERLIGELLQQTILLTDLRPPLTMDAPIRYVLHRLADIPAARTVAAQVESVVNAVAAWDALPLGEQHGTEAYRRLVAQARDVAPTASDTPLQVDLALELGGRTIHRDVGRAAARAAELLLRLSPAPSGPPHLAGYRQAFVARYGMQREVPLLELLDPGVGLGAPLKYGRGHTAIPDARARQRAQTLLNLAHSALNEHRMVVDLDAETVERLETWPPSVETAPASLDLYVLVGASSPAALDAGEFELVVGPNIGALAAGRNLGRFAALLGPEATRALRRIAALEEAQAPDCLAAELVYLPYQLRSANVMVRPAVRGHEIPLGVSAGVPAPRVLRLNELVVGIRDGRFYVRWPAEDAQVVPYSGHMLNYVAAPAPYQFLFDLSRDGVAQLGAFDWGPASRFPFLPRVQMGRIILRPAQWRIDLAARLRELPPDPAERFMQALQDWRVRWHVPRHVHLTVMDNRLLLDLEDARQSGELRTEVRGLPEAGQVVLQEALPSPDRWWAAGPQGRHVTELVVTLVLRHPSTEAVAGGNRAGTVRLSPVSAMGSEPIAATDRLRPPGSEWLFVKLYGPRTGEDALLSGPVRDLAEQAISASWATQWFFIRYADPAPHLRLRFRGDPADLTGRLLPVLCTWGANLMAENRCQHFAIDTYEREIERYGGQSGMEVAEAIFASDSRAVVALLDLLQGQQSDLDHLTLAILSVDDLLEALGMTGSARLKWYSEAGTARDAAGTEYRRRKALLRRLLGSPEQLMAQRNGAAIAGVLAERRAALAPAALRLARLEAAGGLGQGRNVLYRSYVHLHCNRLLGANQAAETMIIGLLARTLDGLARGNERNIT